MELVIRLALRFKHPVLIVCDSWFGTKLLLKEIHDKVAFGVHILFRLRISEVIALKVGDSGRMSIRIKNSKGNKDRYTILSPRLLLELRAYWKNYQPKDFLFPSQIKGQQLSLASPDVIFRDARKQAKITKAVTFHILRHTFATN